MSNSHPADLIFCRPEHWHKKCVILINIRYLSFDRATPLEALMVLGCAQLCSSNTVSLDQDSVGQLWVRDSICCDFTLLWWQWAHIFGYFQTTSINCASHHQKPLLDRACREKEEGFSKVILDLLWHTMGFWIGICVSDAWEVRSRKTWLAFFHARRLTQIRSQT